MERMCTTKQKMGSDGPSSNPTAAATATTSWREEAINGGSLRHVDLDTGINGWASPPGHLFSLRSKHYLSKRQKCPSGDCLLLPAGVDWLRSAAKLDNVLGRRDNRVAAALRRAQAAESAADRRGSLDKAFLVAVNLQIPGREHHSAVFYFAAEEPIATGSLLARFVHGDDDAFRNQRFKIVNRIVRGPWIVRAAVGNYGACLLGKALTCNYHRGPGYLEIDVDIGSSAIANAVLRLALGCVTSVTIDMGFLVEGQAEDELPERLFGAVRICQMEMASATYVDAAAAPSIPPAVPATAGGGKKFGFAKVNDHRSEDGDDDDEKIC